MTTLSFTRDALSICVAGALLAGCGGTQPAIGAPGAMPQTPAIASARSGAHRLSTSYQQLYGFHPAYQGARPEAGLLDVNGTLYGTTYAGGLRAEEPFTASLQAACIRCSIGSAAARTGRIRNQD